MVKNAEEFKAVPFVVDLGTGKPSGKKLRLFAQNLNVFLKEAEFRDKFGFEKEKYSIKECILLLREIYPELYDYLFKKPKINIEEINQIPEEMLEAFAREADSGSLRRIKTSEVKLGAFHERNLIGFIAASLFREGNVLSVQGIYVIPQYSNYGLGAQFIYAIIKRAKRMKLAGVDVNEMTWYSKWLMEKLKKRIEAARLPIKIELFEDEDHGFCADIRFTDIKKN